MADVDLEKRNTPSSLTTLSMTQRTCEPASPICFPKFATTQQAALFQKLKNNQFSGKVFCQTAQGKQSNIYWYLGRIIYVTGGTHSLRRWIRTVLQNCPKLKAMGLQSLSLEKDISVSIRQNHPISWDYDLLCSWLKQQKIDRTQLSDIIASLVTEVLFDLMQSSQVSCHFYPDKKFSYPPVLLDPQQSIVTTWKYWQNWHRSTLGNHSPNEVPVIKNLERLKKRSSPKTYQFLTQYIDGKRSLRDLAVYMDQDLLRLTSSLVLYVQLGLIDLKKIEDLPQSFTLPKQKLLAKNPKKLIACVNDNPRIFQLMNDIITEVGHQFLGISNSNKVISLCVVHKPDLIFVDLEMLGIDSWKICRQLRKSQKLPKPPIIIFLTKKGVFERLHNTIAGCAGFIRKPLNKQEILETIIEHLPQSVAA
ncbi:MAG: response regulator [Crocosphaera sp.]